MKCYGKKFANTPKELQVEIDAAIANLGEGRTTPTDSEYKARALTAIENIIDAANDERGAVIELIKEEDAGAWDRFEGKPEVQAEELDGGMSHAGYNLYPIKTTSGERIGVQSEENKAKGKDSGFGDELYQSIEEAKKGAERQALRAAEKEKQVKEKEKRDAETASATSAKKADTANGFLDGMTPLHKGNALSVLGKNYKFSDGRSMSIRERIEELHGKGEISTRTYTEPKVKPLTRTQSNRADNREQEAHRKKMEAAGDVTVYIVNDMKMGKIAFDYANHLKTKTAPILEIAQDVKEPKIGGYPVAGLGDKALAATAENGNEDAKAEIARRADGISEKPALFSKSDLDYQGNHTPPMSGSGAPLNDLTGGGDYYPDDIYSSKAAQYYGHFGGKDPIDKQTISLIHQYKGRPNDLVTIYRAIPDGVNETISNGDWVTINRNYAKEHGESYLEGNYKIVSKKVKVSEVFSNGDSIHEFGYDTGESVSKNHPDTSFSKGAATPQGHTPEALSKRITSVLESQAKGLSSLMDNLIKVDRSSEDIPARILGGGALYHAAWHGSPNRFDKFDSAHMGSGEGAQAYGWGHYFAGNKEVAEWYRKSLEQKDSRGRLSRGALDGVDYQDLHGDERLAATWVSDWGSAKDALNALTKNGDMSEVKKIVQDIANGKRVYIPRKGQLYKVEIPEEDTYLLWDKPLSEQPKKVRDALKKWAKETAFTNTGGNTQTLTTSLTGKEIYQAITSQQRSDQAASEYLHSIGISGIKYLDGSSRGKGEGSYNYVVFDDGAIQITEKLYSKSGDIRAYVDPQTNVAHFIAENIPANWTDKQILGLLTHEISEHILQLGKSDAEYQSILKQANVMRKLGNKAMRAAYQRAVDAETVPENMDREMMGYFLEENPTHSLSQKFIAWFRKMLRSLSANIKGADKLRIVQWANKLSEGDIIQMASDALKGANREQTKGNQSGKVLEENAQGRSDNMSGRAKDGFVMASRADLGLKGKFNQSDYRKSVTDWAQKKWGDQTAPDGSLVWQNFVQWFGGSVITNDDGTPKVIYHGTDKAFNKLNMKKGAQGVFWVTSDKSAIEAGEVGASGKGNIMEMYAAINNPAGWREYENLSLGEIEGRGYDGVVLPDDDGTFNAIILAPGQVKSATKNDGSYSQTDGSILHSKAPDGKAVDRMTAVSDDLVDKAKELNRKLREENVTVWDKSKKWLKRQLFPGGLLPDMVFKQKIRRDSEFEAIEFDVKHLVGQLERAIKKDYGDTARNLDETTQRLLSDVMAGNVAGVPEDTKIVLLAMRQYIDGLSKQYVGSLSAELASMPEGAAAAQRAATIDTILGNIGEYVHRSYRAFDDPKWALKVPDDVLNSAREYLVARYAEDGADAVEASRKAEVALNEILKHGTAYESMEGFIKESKVGAKDMSILTRRKKIAPEIKALLGEYTDPRINFAKSATKMGRLIFNQQFLNKVREIGIGEFLFTDETKPPEATTQIAAEKSEAYAPLNGLWTTPEVNQAFKDALGKEQMENWYRTIVQINGMVKYGKAQPLDAIVYTPDGPTTMGSLVVGDEVCGAGKRTSVMGVYPQGMMDVYRVTFSDGSSTEATGEHLWEVIGLEKRYSGVFTTEQITSFPTRIMEKSQIAIPVAHAEFNAQDVPVDPYLLGALIGDGCLRGSTLRFSTGDEQMVHIIRELLPNGLKMEQPPSWADADYSITALTRSQSKKEGNPLIDSLKALGLWGHLSLSKFIPESYKYNSVQVRKAIIQGLLDTDGWVLAQDGQPEFSTSSERLANDFMEVAESLGATALRREKVTASENIGYEIRLRVENTSEWFRLDRKRLKAKMKKKPVKRTFRSIELVGRKECQCIMVDDPRHLYLTNRFIVTHNTVLSPTTAARNWMSAFFFTVANGHFDMRHMAKSVSGLREYFTHSGEAGKLAYLRELKQLGVVYDTPYAGEMMRLLDDAEISNKLILGKGKFEVKNALEYATKFYQFGDDFWKIIGFENEKQIWMGAGLSEQAAKEKAAERIRNTYPTYSMVGRGIQSLRRFPLAGTFVSFPAEIIRTTGNMLRYLAQDMKDPATRPIAIKRAVGLSIVSSFVYALQSVSMAMLGYDDDDEEAVRKMGAPWQRNSNLLFTGRDDKGNIRYMDMSFLDPYNYWKRPINAIMRDQPYEDMVRDILKETLTPFFGTDIAAGVIFEAMANKTKSGGPVYNEYDKAHNQAADIANHLRKTLQPGIASNLERTWKAIDGDVSPSGKKYDKMDEAAAWVGFRMSTLDPKVALYYRSFDFKDAKSNAEKELRDVIRKQKGVDSGDLRDAYDLTVRLRESAYGEMISLVAAARKSGMSNQDIRKVLKSSSVTEADAFAILSGKVPKWRANQNSVQEQAMKARTTFGPDAGREVFRRYREVGSYARSP